MKEVLSILQEFQALFPRGMIEEATDKLTVHREGIRTRRDCYDQKNIAAAIEVLRNGKTFKEASKQFGVGPLYVSIRVRRFCFSADPKCYENGCVQGLYGWAKVPTIAYLRKHADEFFDIKPTKLEIVLRELNER